MPEPDLTCVILAAGTSERMGFDKVSAALAAGDTMLDRMLLACAAFPTVVVLSQQNLDCVKASKRLSIVYNDEPERGMTHSLRLANRQIPESHAIAVMPADLPRIDAATIATVIRAHDGVDVAYPVNEDGKPGHPVIFSPHARAQLEHLPDGDTLRLLRDHAALRGTTVVVSTSGPFEDVDVPHDFYRA